MKNHFLFNLAGPTLLLIILTTYLSIDHSGLQAANAKNFPSSSVLQPHRSPQTQRGLSMAETAQSLYNNGGLFTASTIAQTTSKTLPSSAYIVVHKSTISANFINRVLASFHSPAQGKGQALYNYGKKYGIDPVYALAFFMHESTFGRYGMATVTKSLGNIRCSSGYQCSGGFRQYKTWEAGFVDWYRLIRQQYVQQWHLKTVDQIVATYAPSSENNVQGYILSVKNAVDTWHAGHIYP